jgi:hypothetical protein
MVLASFGCLGVSERPPLTKNWVLVISMFANCFVSCASVSDCVCGMVMLSMMIDGRVRCCFVLLVFCADACGGVGVGVLLLTQVWIGSAPVVDVPVGGVGEKRDLVVLMR